MLNKVFVICMVFLFLILNVNAQSVNVCCERTQNGAFCQNVPQDECDGNYRISPTGCDQTSFCKPGCCVDSDEGLCMENTPQIICEENSGTWLDDNECNVNQCSLGCCILGDQTSFVTQTRCKKLSSMFGLETNFRNNVEDEISCILIANGQDKGACVIEEEGQRNCRMSTREVCAQTDGSEFHFQKLCSNDELATNCGPTEETLCIEGKEEVFFKDSCGNAANIYDANRVYLRDPSYWQELIDKSESCGFNHPKGNAESRICGNCEYFRGSVCGKGDSLVGDYFCKDINCYDTKNGNDYKNGESWCNYQTLTGQNVDLNSNTHIPGEDLVGSRHFRHVCINGDEVVEACADYRQEYCLEQELDSGLGKFKESQCIVNRWTDCIEQENEEDCINKDMRDCYWNTQLEKKNSDDKVGYRPGGGTCLPETTPGSEFWNEEGNYCEAANSQCKATLTSRLFDDKNEDCVEEESYVYSLNNACINMGDCGAYINVGNEFTDDGFELRVEGKKRGVSQIEKFLRG